MIVSDLYNWAYELQRDTKYGWIAMAVLVIIPLWGVISVFLFVGGPKVWLQKDEHIPISTPQKIYVYLLVVGFIFFALSLIGALDLCMPMIEKGLIYITVITAPAVILYWIFHER